MARKKQSWRETPGYGSDPDEGEGQTARNRLPIAYISRPQQSYDHPVFKKISRANSHVNSMNPEDIVRKLRELGLSEKGDLNVTSKRLKNWIRNTKLEEANVEQVQGLAINYLVVIDFEATCERDNPAGFQQEIIEFPAVLVNVEKRVIVTEFHSYCKPIINKKLTHFCTSLTGITQEKVEHAPLFPTVLERFDLWLKRELKHDDKFVVITDGLFQSFTPRYEKDFWPFVDVFFGIFRPWDIAKFLSDQCKLSKIPLPHFFQSWSNLRRHFRNYYKVYNQNLEGMLNVLGMKFVGRPHSGIDDSRNIARIVIQLLNDGCHLSVNECFA